MNDHIKEAVRAAPATTPTVAGGLDATWRMGPGVTMLRLSGAVRARTANAVLHQMLDSIRTDGPTLVVDLSGVQKVDAAGIGVLLAARHQARVLGGDLRLAGVHARLRQVLARVSTHDPLVMADPAVDATNALPSLGRTALHEHRNATLDDRP
jgi:anti-anti-sigma factor